jgi:hypothetical protein
MKTTLPLYLIAIAVSVIALQNAGIIPSVKAPKVKIDGLVEVEGSVDVDNKVDVEVSNTVDVEVSNTVDAIISDLVEVDLSSVAGQGLVKSKQGMYIGVNSTENTIIPIHWGDISIYR